MADEQNLLLKLGIDSKDFEDKIKSAGDAVGGLSSSTVKSLGIAAAAFAGLAVSAKVFFDLAERGLDRNELGNAFEDMAGGAANAKIKLDELKEATGGLLTDIEVFKASNAADSFGLKPELFKAIATEAEKLGDAVGQDLTSSLSSLTQAFGTGQERGLKFLKITVDTTAAQRDLAKELGISVSQLTEQGKLLANQRAFYDAMIDKSNKLGGSQTSVTESVTKLGNAWSNSLDEIGSALDIIPQISHALEGLAKVLDSIDFKTFTQNFVTGLFTIADGYFQTNMAYDYWLQTQRKGEAASKTAKKSYDELGLGVGNLRNKLVDLTKTQEESAKKSKETAETIAKETAKFQQEVLQQELEKQLKPAGGGVRLDILGPSFEETARLLGDTVKKEYLRGLGDAADDPSVQQRASMMAQKTTDEWLQKQKDANKKAADDLEQKFKAAANFFTDALYNVFTGESFNFKDMAMKFAAGVGGGLLASIFPGAGDFGDLQGLGQKIGGSILNGLSDSLSKSLGLDGIFSGLIGGAGGAAGGGAGAAGSAAAGGVAGGLGSLTSLGILGAAGATAYFVFNTTSDNFSGKGGIDKGEATGFAAIDSIFPGVGSGLSKLFGGSGKGARERQAREGFISGLGDKSRFSGIYGDVNLSAGGYNFNGGQRTALSDQAVGLTNPFAQALGGGDKKLTSDLNNIFADSVDDVKNYNQLLIQTDALMSGLGLNANEMKDQLSAAFLDGKVSLEDFTAGIGNLNIVATQDLTGPNSVADALGIVADELSTPRAKLKGLELAFKEMSQVGIDTTSEIGAYLMDRFGPGAVAVFDKLRQSGIDSFEDVKNATSDQMVAIFNILAQFKDQFASAFQEGAQSAEQATAASLDRIGQKIQQTGDQIQNFTTKSGKAVNGKTPNSSNIDDNPANYIYDQ